MKRRQPKETRSNCKILPQGSMLVEMTIALTILTAIGLFLLIGSLDLMQPRKWIITQNVTDAYLTYEEAYAKRIPFEEFNTSTSPWPEYPNKSETSVDLGKAPGGRIITGTVIRTRIADENNLPAPTDSAYDSKLAINPAEMETWKLQSILIFKIGDKDYHKTRTVIRTR